MGQKVNPIANRLGYIKGWESNWYEKPKYFAEKLNEDNQIRAYLAKKILKKIVSKVVIERTFQTITLTIHTSRPGILIGPGGKKIQELKDEIKKKFKKDVRINVYEIKNPDIDARLVASNIADQIENQSSRGVHRRAAIRALDNAERSGAGIKIWISGRIDGIEIARRQEFKRGKVPAHTLRADVDYSCQEAVTVSGKIGVKVWIFKGEVYGKRNLSLNVESANLRSNQKSPRFTKK